jgi:hypothetical protein
MAGDFVPSMASGVTDCGGLVMNAKKLTVKIKGKAI